MESIFVQYRDIFIFTPLKINQTMIPYNIIIHYLKPIINMCLTLVFHKAIKIYRYNLSMIYNKYYLKGSRNIFNSAHYNSVLVISVKKL